MKISRFVAWGILLPGLLLPFKLSAQLVADGETKVIDGTSTNITGTLTIGANASYTTLIVTNGGAVTNTGFGNIGLNDTSKSNRVVVTGANSVWSATTSGSQAINIGSSGAYNQLVISNGGLVINRLGRFGNVASGDNNTAIVTGSNSLWKNLAGLIVGASGSTNQLIVANGGRVESLEDVTIGSPTSSDNLVKLNGGYITITNGSAMDIQNGKLELNSGHVDLTVLTATTIASGQVVFNGGTLRTHNTTNNNTRPFITGNGSSAATLELVGLGGHRFVDGLQISSSASVTGTGTIIGSVTNSGAVNPGTSPGRLIISGSYDQTSAGALNIELTNATPATGFDVFNITGAANLGGALNVTLLGGYYPAPNATFTFLTNASRNGTFTAFNYPSNDVGMTVSYTATAATINVVNVHPVLAGIASQTINENALFTYNAAATDADTPSQTLTYSLTNSPTGASINASGVISWTPTDAQGPLVTNITLLVTDNGSPNLTVSRTFSITVNEVNVAPGLNLPSNQAVTEETPFNGTATVTDTDIPANSHTFELVSGPSGLTVSPSGAIAWTATEAQGPGSYVVFIRVTDLNTNAASAQQLSTTNNFTLTVNESNRPPVLTVPVPQVITEETLLSVSASATDPDAPANSLTFSLVSPPAGMTIDSGSGAIAWTPTEIQGENITYIIKVVVTDDSPLAVNAQNFSVTNTFQVTVNESNRPPVLTLPADTNLNELVLYSATATATDPDLPANGRAFELVSGPPGLMVSTNGAITWMPTEAQGPSTNVVTIKVTDTNPGAVNEPHLSATNSYTLVVNEVNAAPILTLPVNPSVTETMAFSAIATATDSDDPTNSITFELVSGPSGLTVSPGGAIAWTPTEAQGPSNYVVSIRVTDLNPAAVNSQQLSATANFTITVNESNRAPALTVPGPQVITEETLLSVSASATDPDLPANGLTFSLVTPPGGMTIDSGSGAITWTPTEIQGSNNTYTIKVVVTDDSPLAENVQNISVTNTFQVTVNESNRPPALTPISDQVMIEETPLSLLATATDPDLPANGLTFALVSGPSGLTVSSGGAINWTPTEAQGSNSYTILFSVTDMNPLAINATSLSITSSFAISVNESNRAPVLTVPGPQVITEETLLSVSASATDPDSPANGLTFSLVAPPAGMMIDSGSGAITWTPTEIQGANNTYTIAVVVADNSPLAVNEHQLSVTNTFQVTVNESNRPPVLAPMSDQVMIEETPLSLLAAATDPDRPANGLTFALVSGPSGLTVASNGAISWTPTEAQGSNNYTIFFSVTDTNALAINATSLSVTSSFAISVNESNRAPVLTVPTNQTLVEENLLVVSAAATDPDSPANSLAFSLVAPPAGMTIDSGSGAITWTPTEIQGSNAYTIAVVVTDDNPLAVNLHNISVTNTFVVTVNESNRPPVLTLPADATIDELVAFSATATATDPDSPANPLTFALVSGPANLTVSSSGAINWTPTEMQGPSNYVVFISVTDSNYNAVNAHQISVTNSFNIVVNEINVAPLLTLPASTNLHEAVPYNALALATDRDFPVNPLTFALVGGPDGLTVSSNGAIAWLPTEIQGPSTNIVTISVTDLNTNAVNAQALSVTNSYTLVVNEVNVVPMLTLPPNTNHNELEPYSALATATDEDLPINTLTFSLVAGPAGLTVSPDGAINWIPTEAQGPSNYNVFIRVTDLNTNAVNAQQFSVTNSFNIVINEINVPPVLTLPASTNIAESAPYIASATATDDDLPVNLLTFALVEGPPGLIVATNGVIHWTPTEAQGPSNYNVFIRVTDLNTNAVNAQQFSVTNSFTLTVNEVNVPPLLTVPTNQTLIEETPLAVTASAIDLDSPTNGLTFSLVAPPAGMTIHSSSGAIDWTPNEAQGFNIYSIHVVVTDENLLAVNAQNISVTNTFLVTVNESNRPPVLTLPADTSIDELVPYSATATATDPDLPVNDLTFALVSGPAGVNVSAAGAITWLPIEAQGSNYYTISISVTDHNPDAVNEKQLSVTNSYSVIVHEVNLHPSFEIPLSAQLGTNGYAFSYILPPNTFVELDNDQTISYVASNVPPGLVFSGPTRTFSGIPNVAGIYHVTVTATDSWIPSLSSNAFFTISISNAPYVRWTNVAGGNWNVPANWFPTLVPGTNDHAFITNIGNGNYTVNVTADAETGDLTLGNASSSITLGGAATLTIKSNLVWAGGTIGNNGGRTVIAPGATLNLVNDVAVNLYGHTLENGGTALGTGTSYLNALTVAGFPAVITNRAGALFEVRNDQAFYRVSFISTDRFDNAGTLRKTTGTGTTSFSGDFGIGLPFNNYGTVEIQTGTLLNAGTMVNNGAITLSPGTTHLIVGGGAGSGSFTAPATALVDWTANIFTLNSGAQLNGEGLYRVSGSAMLTCNESLAVRNLDLLSTLNGSGTMTVSNVLNWTGGMLGNNGGGRTVIVPGATLNLANAAPVNLYGHTLENGGTVLWTGSSYLNALTVGGVPAIITNRAGALFEARNDQAFYRAGFISTDRFDNAGIFRKTIGTGTTAFDGQFGAGLDFNNYGSVEIQTGNLTLGGSGTHTGSFDVPAGTSLIFVNGTHAASGASSLTGAGQLTVSGATVTLAGLANVSGTNWFTGGTANLTGNYIATNNTVVISGGTANFSGTGPVNPAVVNLSNGTLGGTGMVTVGNVLNWTGGTMGNAGGGTVIAPGATLYLANADPVNLFGHTLENGGTALWTGTSYLNALTIGGVPAVITNRAGALFEARNDQVFYRAGFISTDRFDNTGIFRKTIGPGATAFDGQFGAGLPFNNYGIVEIQTGTLLNTGPMVNNGSIILSAGTTNLIVGGGSTSGSFTAPATALVDWTANTFTLNSGAQLNGDGLYRVNGTATLTCNESLAVRNLDLLNTLNGSGTLTVSNVLNWTAGMLGYGGAGRTVIAPGATLNLANGDNVSLFGHTLENGGTTLWTGSGNVIALTVGVPAVITNRVGALFEARNNQALYRASFISADRFDNAGIFRKAIGTGTTSFSGDYGIGLDFNNYGTLDIRSGIITANGGYNSSSDTLLNCTIGGTNAGTDYGQLQVSGAVALNGSLSVDFTNGFVPGFNPAFTIVTAGTRNGTFANFYYPSNDASLHLLNTATAVIVVGDNTRPLVVNSIPNTNGTYGAPLSFSFATDTFIDLEGLSLSYTADNLPPGLAFDGPSRTFSGTPTQAGTNIVTVTATDSGSPSASTNTTFALVISNADTAVALASSLNPAPVGASITFTATVSTLAPSLAPVGGEVQFRIDGAAYGGLVPLLDGVATVETALLTTGSHDVTAEFADLVNFNGSTNSLAPAQVVNPPPPSEFIVTTTNNTILVTDVLGGDDTLVLFEPGAGLIQFAGSCRTFNDLNGGPNINGNSGPLSLVGITNIIVNAGGGTNSITVGAFTGTLPELTILRVAGTNRITLRGALTFALNRSLNATGTVINVAAPVTVSGSGRIALSSSEDLMLETMAVLTTAAGGSVTLSADCNADASGLVTTAAGSSVSTSGGAVTLTAADVMLAGNITASGGTVDFHASQTDAPIVLGEPSFPEGTQLWKALCGSTSADSIKAMQVDAAGNVYLLGALNAGTPRQFNGNTITGRGLTDVFVAKLNPDGSQVYFRRAGSTSSDTPIALVVDNSGNAVVAGMMNGTSTPRNFDGTILTGQAGNDIFVAKLDPNGAQLYFKFTGSTLADVVRDLAVDNDGNAYLTGLIGGAPGNTPKDFNGNAVLTGIGGVDVFLAKFDASGSQEYFKLAGSTQADNVSKVIVDGSGNAYLLGTIFGTEANTPTDFNGNALAGIGQQDAFVAKLDSLGNQVFCKLAGSGQNDVASVMAVDANGNVILGGSLTVDPAYTPRDFNGTPITGYPGPGGGAMFVAKLDGSGAQQFFQVGGNTLQFVASSVPTALVVDGAGQIYLSGTVHGDPSTEPKDFNGNSLATFGDLDVFVAKLNSSGVQQYFKLAGSAAADTVTAMALGADGHVKLTGTLNGDAGNSPQNFAGHAVTGFGNADVYVASLNACGDQDYFRLAGSTADDASTALTVDGKGNVLITGMLAGSFGSSPTDFGGNLLGGFESLDLFVAKLDASGGQQFFKIAGSTGADTATAVAVDPAGDVWFAGTIIGGAMPTDFAGEGFAGYGSTTADVLVAKLRGNNLSAGFALSDAELDHVTAATVGIGEAGSGAISVEEIISPVTYQILALKNDTTITPDGGLLAMLGGTIPGTDFSQVQVSGTATLAGTLFTELANEFYPAPDGTFPVLLADRVVGEFEYFNYPVTDVGMLANYSATDVTISINNIRPAIAPISQQTGVEYVPFSLTVSATDFESPTANLSYALIDSPVDASIDANGVISWTPTEEHGPLTNSITVLVTDDSTPSLTATLTFTVAVSEVNVAPELFLPPDTNHNLHLPYSATAMAADSDLPVNALVFALVSGPVGLTVAPDGLIEWTPTGMQGPGAYLVTVKVTDYNPDAINEPQLSTTNSFTITLEKVLEISANPATRLYGQTNPTFTGTMVGLVNGDNITATYTTTATPCDPPGTYPITVTIHDPDNHLGDYTVITNDNVLTVLATDLKTILSFDQLNTPYAPPIEGSDGVLYGATHYGGVANEGAIYRVNKDGSDFAVLRELNSDMGDGIQPFGKLIEGSSGALFGTTLGGGANASGVVFKINKDGTDFLVLHDFGAASDGALPYAGLVEGTNGAIYGTTYTGGTNTQGTIFKLNQDGSDYAVLHRFAADASDGANPFAGLIQGSDGNLYGLASAGGPDAGGVAFKIATDGTGYEVLHTFGATATDAVSPAFALTQGSDGVLYGTSLAGGDFSAGTVFKLNRDGSGYAVLRSLGLDANSIYGSLVERNDVLYSASTAGGLGFGTVFKINKDGSDFSVITEFNPFIDSGGVQPVGLTLASDGQIYGATAGGGTNGMGTVFRLRFATESAPVVANAIPDQSAVYGAPFNYTFPMETFTDADLCQTLSYTASNLPPGIVFDGPTRTFSGIPTNVGSVVVTVTATDDGSPPLSANTTFSLVVAKVDSVISVASSLNPALPGANVTFTATVGAALPSQALLEGEVQFRVDGAAVGGPVALVSGTASVEISSLAHGSPAVTVEFAGSPNFNGTTNSLAPPQIINTPPVAGNVTYERPPGVVFRFRISTLLTNCSDVEGDGFVLSGVSNPSTNNAIVTTNATFIFYQPPQAGGNVTDALTYTVRDVFGGSATGRIVLTIQAPSTQPTPNIVAFTVTSGVATITFAGIPNQEYYIQATTNLSNPDWRTIGTNLAGTNGLFIFTDVEAINYPARFYRTAAP